jgi:hypothetical protein
VLALSLFFLRRASTGGDGAHKTIGGAHAITATVKDTIDTSLNQKYPLPQASLTSWIAWRVHRYAQNRVSLPLPREGLNEARRTSDSLSRFMVECRKKRRRKIGALQISNAPSMKRAEVWGKGFPLLLEYPLEYTHLGPTNDYAPAWCQRFLIR